MVPAAVLQSPKLLPQPMAKSGYRYRFMSEVTISPLLYMDE